MADVFISYARADRPRAAAIAKAIEARRWTVWWDPKLRHGDSYSEVIERELTAARCVIVLWTHHSVSSDWVQAEAADGATRKILVPAKFDDVHLPLEFRRKHTADLTAWDLVRQSRELEELLASVGSILGRQVTETDAPTETNSPTEMGVRAVSAASRASRFAKSGPPVWRTTMALVALLAVAFAFAPQLIGFGKQLRQLPTEPLAETTTATNAFTGQNPPSTPAPAEFTQQGTKLVAVDAKGYAFQGASLALSADGNTAIVGGWGDDRETGAAWIWTRRGDSAFQQGSKLVGSGASGVAHQGTDVALSADGRTAIVGGATDNGRTGAVWIWTRTGDVWKQQGPKLVGSGAIGESDQGQAVALSADGNTAIVGGWLDDEQRGAVWIWIRTGDVWMQQGPKLVPSGAFGLADFGYSVALSADGDTAIVGGHADDATTGAVWVWQRSEGFWTQRGPKLIGSGAAGKAFQGVSVSLSADGNTAVVGGRKDDNYIGAAWIWRRSGNGVWSPDGPKLVGTGSVGNSEQGFSVHMSDDGLTAIVGACDDNSGAGAAWVWRKRHGVWAQLGLKLVGTGTVGNANQGTAVALSADGSTALIGGQHDDNSTGAVWVFTAAKGVSPES